MKQALIYCLKVWLTSSLLSTIASTVLVIVAMRTVGDPPSVYLSFFGVVLVQVLLDSLIPLLIAYLFMTKIINSTRPPFESKAILFLTIVLIFGAILVIEALVFHIKADKMYWVGFVIATALCIWFYKLKQQTKHEGTIQRPNL